MRHMVALGAVMLLAGGAMAQTPGELKVGDMAPEFSLKGTDGKTHTLSDYRGKKAVVVAWFPKAFTQGCTIECKSLAQNGDKLRQFEVAYFMASVDPLEGPQGNEAFAKSENADFPLLSDPTKEVATKYGVLSERGSARRWTFYIGKDGRITHIEKAVKPATSAEDMLAKLEELKVPRSQ